MQPTRENTLYLPIKQKYFDEILAGTKKTETREIKDTTYQKYLHVWREGGESGLYFDDTKIDYEPDGNYFLYNNGVYPFMPIEYKYLELAVGYAKERDVMVVKVKKITFEPMLNKKGKPARFDIAGDEYIENENGGFCIWQVVYHLDKIVEAKLKNGN